MSDVGAQSATQWPLLWTSQSTPTMEVCLVTAIHICIWKSVGRDKLEMIWKLICGDNFFARKREMEWILCGNKEHPSKDVYINGSWSCNGFLLNSCNSRFISVLKSSKECWKISRRFKLMVCPSRLPDFTPSDLLKTKLKKSF